jgi:hypothetical protein
VAGGCRRGGSCSEVVWGWVFHQYGASVSWSSGKRAGLLLCTDDTRDRVRFEIAPRRSINPWVPEKEEEVLSSRQETRRGEEGLGWRMGYADRGAVSWQDDSGTRRRQGIFAGPLLIRL